MTEHAITKKHYFVVFGTLMVLLVVTVAIAEVDLGWFNIVAALSIACLKAVLIAVYFMHLKTARQMTRLWAVTSVLWLGILIVLTYSDTLTRTWGMGY